MMSLRRESKNQDKYDQVRKMSPAVPGGCIKGEASPRSAAARDMTGWRGDVRGGVMRRGDQREDASLWQIDEGNARVIAAALSGDTSIRRIEDVGERAVNQSPKAKTIASGDDRLMRKAGLEADIARIRRLQVANEDNRLPSVGEARA
jgi:hypothetical protein